MCCRHKLTKTVLFLTSRSISCNFQWTPNSSFINHDLVKSQHLQYHTASSSGVCNHGNGYNLCPQHKKLLTRYQTSPLCTQALFTRHQTSPLCTHASHDTETYDPYKLVEDDLLTLCDDIKEAIQPVQSQLKLMTHYHFDGKGKSFRPMVVLLMARACNMHTGSQTVLDQSQKQIAMITEMIHTASLVHDDVIDEAEKRRGKPSVHNTWGQKNAIIAGDYIMSAASVALAQIRNIDVVTILSQVLEDLVSGEFMQLGSKEDENERFNHYLSKTYKKTASLIANSCKAVAVLADCGEDATEYAFQYGRNIGIAFQLVDDLLDFISSEALMGKPTAADLKLGLATAPVLFAAHQHPELNAMIMRRFDQPGDIKRAWELVGKSDGMQHTRYLAEQHCKEAVRQISQLSPSVERKTLEILTHKVLNRLK